MPVRITIYFLIAILTCLPAAGLYAGPAIPHLANTCGGCHSLYTHGYGEIPSLDRYHNADDLYKKLLDFKSGALSSTVMNRVCQAFDDKQLNAIARLIARPGRVTP